MEFLEDLWTGITRNFTNSKEQEDFDYSIIVFHGIFCFLFTVIIGLFTPLELPLELYAIVTIVATIIFAIFALFWSNADIKDNLAAGYFFLAVFFSFAWVLYVPIALIVFVFGFPIFYSKIKNKKK